MKKTLAILAAASILFGSCNRNKATDPEPQATSAIQVVVNNVVNKEPLILNTKLYTNPLDQEFNVTVFKYFLSNFRFVKADGSTFTIPQDSCYFLVDQTNPESFILDFKIPPGSYKAVQFMMGVDSLRNTKGIDERQGDLDPTNAAMGMYWTWNSGYIHFMFEGKSSSVPTSLVPNQQFQFHIGGFGGYSSPTPNNTREITMDLTEKGTLQASDSKTSKIYINTDIYTFFNTYNVLDLTEAPLIMTDKAAVKLADNATNIFFHTQTKND